MNNSAQLRLLERLHECEGFHDNSLFRLPIFRLLLYTSVWDSYTSNFCFSKSLFSSIPTSTYTMIHFYQSRFHLYYDNTTYTVSVMTIQLVLSVKDAYFHQSHFQLGRIRCINPASIGIVFVSSLQLLFEQGES